MVDTDDDPETADVVIVGGGPTGASAGVFTARYGLETLVFDRGPSSLQRCAYLQNYPGFPGGIDVETFRALLADHAREAGCTIVPDLVERVERAAGGFVVRTQEGRSVEATRVVAATRYDGAYLRPLGDPDDMFRVHEHEGQRRQFLDPDWPDEDGRTPVEGCYVAAPAGERDVQAILAAGRGARVARSLLADHRRDRGYPDGVARHYDWMRPPTEFEGPWADRERWREWFDERVADGAELDPGRLADLREREVDRAFETRLSASTVANLTAAGQSRLASHLDPEHVLAAVDDERIRDYLDDE